MQRSLKSISLAESIEDEINKIAETHHRSRSNMIVVILKDFAEKRPEGEMKKI